MPSYIIQQTTTFNLVVTNNNDPNATSIISNSITITPSNTSFTGSLNTTYGSNNTLDIYSNVIGSSPSSYKFNVQLEQDEKQYLGSLNNANTTWTLTFNNKTIVSTTQASTLSFDLPISDLTQSGTYTLSSSTQLVGISTAITASYTINYSQLTISSNTGHDGTLSINESSFGSLINTAYYFWQVEESNNSWTTVSSNNTSSSSFDVSNLTSAQNYRVIVANNANWNDATIKIISDSYNLNEITSSINVTNAFNTKNNIYEAKYNSNVTLTASNINLNSSSNVTYQWYCNNKPITDENSNSYSFTQDSSSNSYYVVLYIKGIKQTQSQTITVNPLYDSSKFSLAIYENNNSNNIANTTINDLQNISSYDLSIKLLYDGSVFDTQPTSNIIWTLNDESFNNNSLNYNASLNVGKNLISVKLNDLSNSYGIVGNSLVANLTINYVELEITTSNSRPIVNYDGSITLTQECLSYNSFKSIDTNQNAVSYQWYEVDGSNNEKILSATSSTYTFSNLINNTTYYLVATYTFNGQTYTWTSNKITVTVNQVPNLVSPKIVCDTNANSTPLNLDESLINKNPNYEFSIYSNDNAISDINGTVTYTLTNTLNNDKIVLSSSASLDTPFSIDFATLHNFNYGTYTLTASIIIPSANATNITYKASEVDSLTITYSNISINVSSNATQVQNSTTYDAQIGSNVTLTANKASVYISNSTPSYQWEEYIDGKWTLASNTNNTDTLSINNINSGSNLTYRLIETIDNLTLTSNSITISPIIPNQIKANITSTNTKAVANTLNIYNQSQQTQTLTLSFSNVNTSNLTGLNVEWLVN
ncbi:MAG: hypothetical protein IIT78_02155, partial [Mycoplasmataceae bacterium]|nr:hypothetical protein [Mycoplasmataceae bacterium]